MLKMFHILPESFLPLFSSISVLGLLSSFILLFWTPDSLFEISMVSFNLGSLMFLWFYTMIMESKTGAHNPHVKAGLLNGFLWFVFSEVCFFASWFWAFFHNLSSPGVEIGSNYSYGYGLESIDPFSLPLINTLILLSSGISVTVAHHLFNSKASASSWLFITVGLGVLFFILQMVEYSNAPFTVSDSSFGSAFFITTGFHGLHVFIGALMLLVVGVRVQNAELPHTFNVGFDSSVLYWHFVDVVWLFLFTFMYCWV